MTTTTSDPKRQPATNAEVNWLKDRPAMQAARYHAIPMADGLLPTYVADHDEHGDEAWNRFITDNPDLVTGCEPSGLLANLLERTQGAEHIPATSIALDHLERFYHQPSRRHLLVSHPNCTSQDYHCRCVDELRRVVDELNKHRPDADGLVVYAGDLGTSWRKPAHPLVIIAPRAVPVVMPTPEPVC